MSAQSSFFLVTINVAANYIVALSNNGRFTIDLAFLWPVAVYLALNVERSVRSLMF